MVNRQTTAGRDTYRPQGHSRTLAQAAAGSLPPVTTDQIGTVLSWSEEAGFGFIEGDNGTTYFVHFSGIEMDGYKTLKDIRRVVFDVDPEGFGDAPPDSGDRYAQLAIRVQPTDS